MSFPASIPLDSLGEPFYRGSVQRLYAIPGCDSHMVTETTSQGSVFDVGSIFEIPGSDLSRAVFRHALYSRMHSPELWQEVRQSIEKSNLPNTYRRQLLTGPLEELCQHGARTHHEGMIDADTGRVVTEGIPASPSCFNVVRRYQILKPDLLEILGNHVYDYESFWDQDGYVIPLEYIVRFGITSASSIYRKYLGMAERDRKTYEAELGATSELIPWTMLERPISDCTTKFEPEDRNVSRQEALTLCGLPGPQFGRTLIQAVLGAWTVRHLLERIDLALWDIKWEFAAEKGDTVFVDTIDTDSFRGTRFLDTSLGRCVIHFNKQAIRDYYTLVHPAWLDGVNTAKARARSEGVPFPEMLAKGQEDGTYPGTPTIESEFLDLQSSKMNWIQHHMLQDRESAEVSARLEELAREEFEFYQSRELATGYLERNGIPTSQSS